MYWMIRRVPDADVDCRINDVLDSESMRTTTAQNSGRIADMSAFAPFFSKKNSIIAKYLALFVASVLATPVFAQLDKTAKYFHVFPHVVDGIGWQSSLVVTSTAHSSSSCTLRLNGLTMDRFEDADGIVTYDTTADFNLPESGGHLIWNSKGESDVKTGYMTLDCADPVTTQLILTRTDILGNIVGINIVSGAQVGSVFQLPVLTKDTIMTLSVANDTEVDAVCGLSLQDLEGMSLGQVDMTVPSRSNHSQVLNESLPIPETFLGGSATVDCDQQVALVGIHSESQTAGFSTSFGILMPTVRPTNKFENTEKFWDGNWEDSIVTTHARSDIPYVTECNGLLPCEGVKYPLTVRLIRSNSMVTGSIKTQILGKEMEWNVGGEVPDDGTLRLFSEDVLLISFSSQSPPADVVLESWESRQDVPGIMTGSVAVGISVQGVEVVVKGCLGNGDLASTAAASSDDRLLSSACMGLQRSP